MLNIFAAYTAVSAAIVVYAVYLRSGWMAGCGALLAVMAVIEVLRKGLAWTRRR